MIRLAVSIEYRRVTDRQTDRQTNGRTDGGTDGHLVTAWHRAIKTGVHRPT